MSIKDYFLNPVQWLLAGVFILALVFVNRAASDRGYAAGQKQGYGSGLSTGRQDVIKQNTARINSTVKETYVQGCVDVLRKVMVQSGIDPTSHEADAIAACTEDARSLPYFNLQ